MALLIVGTIILTTWLCSLYYEERVETLKEQRDQARENVQRLKGALGIELPDKQSGLMALTNMELRDKGRNLAKDVRHISRDHKEKLIHLVESDNNTDLMRVLLKSEHRMQEIIVDSSSVIKEMGERLAPEEREEVYKSLPRIMQPGSEQAVLYWDLPYLPSGALIYSADAIARAIDELSQRLPNNSSKRQP
jgi:hypothetical protein